MSPPWEINSTAKAVIGYAATVAAVLLFLSPMRTFLRILQKKSVGAYSPLPYSMSLNNCFTWTVYGLPNVTPGRTAVWLCNGIGVVLELFYLTVFTVYTPNKKKMAFLHLLPCGIYCALIASLTFAHVIPEDHTTTVLGVLGALWCFAMYSAPLAVMKQVISTRSVEYMPLSLALGSLGCSSLWFTYGVYVLDWYIIAPNGPGVLISLAQLALFFRYAPKGKSPLEELMRMNTTAAGHQFPPAGPEADEKEEEGADGTTKMEEGKVAAMMVVNGGEVMDGVKSEQGMLLQNGEGKTKVESSSNDKA